MAPQESDSRPVVPRWLDGSFQIALRLLVVGAAVAIILVALAQLRFVVLAVIAALMLTTLLEPLARRLVAAGLPGAAAAFAPLLGALIVFGGLLALLAPRVADQVDELNVSLGGGISRIEEWLHDGPLGLSDSDVSDLTDRAAGELRDRLGDLTESVLSGALVVVEVIAGAVFALVITFFFLKDGAKIRDWLIRLVNDRQRDAALLAAAGGWSKLGAYLRGITLAALVEAVLVAVVLALAGVPLVLPLAVLTFLGAYIPIVGAFAVGMMAALVTLFSEGLTTAIVVVGAYVVIQQLESNVLHPLIVGRSVELPPLVVLLAVATGGVLAGIIGAFLAVPLTAVAVGAAHAVGGTGADPDSPPPPASSRPAAEP